MPNYFSERMKQTTDHELERMVERPKKYVLEAVEAATKELEDWKNGVSFYIDISKIEKQKRKLKKPKSKPRFRFIRSFTNFVLNPNTVRIRTSGKNRLLLTLRFYFLTFFFLFISTIPIFILEKLGIVKDPKQIDYIPDYFDNPNDILLSSILISIIAGVLEEANFRLVLTRFNKKYFDIFLSLTAGRIVYYLFGRYLLIIPEFFSSYLIQSTVIYLLFAVPIYMTLSRSNTHSSWFEKNWNKAF